MRRVVKFSCIFLCFIIVCSLLYKKNILPHPKFPSSKFNIEPYISLYDLDNDGLDDQSDILKSAKDYVATKPKYKSKYYATGYPNDTYGVCTDVVAFALLHAGYDLKEEVYTHIKKNRDLYDIDIVDENIDFRRVRNLIIFFEHNFQVLTNDISKIEEWQGGDIVAFHEHIGIVSDNRNDKGIPFVIHHRGRFQLYYEEDILENSIVIGHYRIK